MAGAAVISAISNALAGRELPFVFGGDGALVALAPTDHGRARGALAEVQTWVREDLGLGLRAALVPVAEIRAAGLDVRAAKFRVAPGVSYAMFSGGGANWADREMKAGRFVVPPASPGSRPDLTGLNCRWNPIRARNGTIVSIIAVPRDAAPAADFERLVGALLALLGDQDRDGHPVPIAGPTFAWLPDGLDYEARAAARPGRRLLARARILCMLAIAQASDAAGRPVGTFDAPRYRADTAANSDFRKFDDGLKLTVDVSNGVSDEIEELLRHASRDGTCRYGIHRQDDALVTCIVPSFSERNHMHFIDGAGGGYAMAAAMLKAAG